MFCRSFVPQTGAAEGVGVFPHILSVGFLFLADSPSPHITSHHITPHTPHTPHTHTTHHTHHAHTTPHHVTHRILSHRLIAVAVVMVAATAQAPMEILAYVEMSCTRSSTSTRTRTKIMM